MPPIVASELLSGRMTEDERSTLESFLESLPLCSIDLAHSFRVGRLRAALAAKGISVSTPDADVAQCAIELAAVLLSKDAIFGHVAQHTGLKLFGSL